MLVPRVSDWKDTFKVKSCELCAEAGGILSPSAFGALLSVPSCTGSHNGSCKTSLHDRALQSVTAEAPDR